MRATLWHWRTASDVLSAEFVQLIEDGLPVIQDLESTRTDPQRPFTGVERKFLN
jgi:hypothetical protein